MVVRNARPRDVVTGSALDWHVIRPPAIYGPGDTDNLELFRFAKRGIVPLPRAGHLSLLHADECARLIVALLDHDEASRIYEADDGRSGGWSYVDYARAIGTAVGSTPRVVRLPKSVLNLASMVDTRIRGPRAKLTRDRVSYMTHPDWVIKPALRPPPDLWTPQIDTVAGLAQTAAWYRDHGWL